MIDSDLNFAAVPFYLPGMPKQNPAAQHLQNQNFNSNIVIWISFPRSVFGSVSKMEAILFLYLVQKNRCCLCTLNMDILYSKRQQLNSPS